MKSIIIAHPGKQHSFQTAVGVKKTGFHMEYCTTVYDKPGSLTNFIKRFLNKNDSEKANTRRSSKIKDTEVHQILEWYGLYQLFMMRRNISGDAQAYMRRIVQILHQFDESSYSQKPQILIITNYVGLDENYVDHISALCGCKPIKKYIDDKIQKHDQDSGLAPTLQTVCDFYGTAGEVEADALSTKFVDPSLMYESDENGNFITDESGNFIPSKTYTNIVNFLKAEYTALSSQGGHAGALGALKRQINAVKSNMVELFIGGISISDRDSLRDLVEDAVLNTRSAA